MTNNVQPWDNLYQRDDIASTATQGSSLQKTQYIDGEMTTRMKTMAGIEEVKYGSGKPVRTSIIGDLKHDFDQR